MKLDNVLSLILETISPEMVKKMIESGDMGDSCEPVLSLDKPNKTSKVQWYGFSLTSGDSCPYAGSCRELCFRQRDENRFKKRVLAKVDNNFQMLKSLKTTKEMADLIERSINMESGALKSLVFRIHNGGDFFSEKYFRAWIEVAKRFPNKLFYAYTTSVKFWINNMDIIPKNFVLNASWDSAPKSQELIVKHKLKTAFIVDSKEQAEELGLEIDKDDSLAWGGKKSFALLQHNSQVKNLVRQRIRERTSVIDSVLKKIRG